MFKKLITTLLVALFLSGCVTKAKRVETTHDVFFSTNVPESKAIIFFTCGTLTTKSWLGEFETNLGGCSYKIDSIQYTQIDEGTVSKIILDSKEHTLEFRNTFDNNFVLKKVKLNAGDVLLATLNHTVLVGPIGGLIGGLTNQYIYDIDIDRENVVSKVVNKTPVFMTKSK